MKVWHYFKDNFVIPRTKNQDRARREFVLNVLLCILAGITGIAFLINLFQPIINPGPNHGEVPVVTGLIFLLFCGLLVLSRSGKGKLAGLALVTCLFLVALYRGYYWGPDANIVLLLFALIITLAGVILGSRGAFIVTLLSGSSIVILTILIVNGYYSPNDVWKSDSVVVSDAIVFALLLLLISTIAWIFNRDMEKALVRARRSEQALKNQRDQLEITVEKRTNQLRVVQAEKIAQLYRFAEFGKLSSGLFHDLVNPLTIVSLNLKNITKNKEDLKEISNIKVGLERAILATKRLESFVEAARMQIQNRDLNIKFSLVKETNQSLQMLEHKAKENRVELVFNNKSDIRVFGNPFRYNQLILNLVSNSIDAYDNTKKQNRKIEILIEKNKESIVLQVKDWGIGIKKSHLEKIFEPLFTTKSFAKGTGMGLSICKDIVDGMDGTIIATSNRKEGTVIAITFPSSVPNRKIQ